MSSTESKRAYRRGLVAVVALGILATGCSMPSAERTAAGKEPVQVSGSPTGKNPTGVVGENGPIRDVVQGGTDWLTAELAFGRHEDRATDKCMQELGYSYRSPTPDKDLIRRDGLANAYGTDLADAEFRREEGYGVTGGLVGLRPRTESSDPVGKFTHGMNPTQEGIFRKSLSDCGKSSSKKVMHTPAFEALLDGSAGLGQRVDSDPRLVVARRGWTRCMSDHGYPAKDANDLLTKIESKSRPLYDSANFDHSVARKLHAEELRIANIDWACRVKTINPVLKAVRAEIEGSYIEAHPELIAKVREEMKALIAK